MTITVRKYEEVPCPHCGAAIGEHCISKQGRDLETQNQKWRNRRGHYAHSERRKRYEKKNGPPVAWTGWPIGKVGT